LKKQNSPGCGIHEAQLTIEAATASQCTDSLPIQNIAGQEKNASGTGFRSQKCLFPMDELPSSEVWQIPYAVCASPEVTGLVTSQLLMKRTQPPVWSALLGFEDSAQDEFLMKLCMLRLGKQSLSGCVAQFLADNTA
jgi:hypothetical protein